MLTRKHERITTSESTRSNIISNDIRRKTDNTAGGISKGA